MSNRGFGILLALVVAAFILVYLAFRQQFTGTLLNVALHPDLQEVLSDAKTDLKEMAQLDPENRDLYRARFDRITKLQGHFNVLDLNRGEILARFEMTLAVLLALILVSALVVHLFHSKRVNTRLSVLRGHLADLAAGAVEIRVPDRRDDIIGRIGLMIEETAHVIGLQQQRLRGLDNLNAWQEAARRQAHEIRTPLMAAKMSVNQLFDLATAPRPAPLPLLEAAQQDAVEELNRLKRFTDAFTSFAKIGKPQKVPCSVYDMLAQFTRLYREAWPNLSLVLDEPEKTWVVPMDRDLIHQVLVNLCSNSANAMGDRQGELRFRLTGTEQSFLLYVGDNGPGIDPKIGDRLFEPYVTSRNHAEGMGLGLAVSRKILLDHGGDLRLQPHEGPGALFLLQLPLENEDDQ